MWTDPAVLAEAQQGLVRSGEFRAVTGALESRQGTVSPSALAQAHALLSSLRSGRRPAPRAPRRASTSSTAVYRAYQASSQFISADGRTIQFETALRAGPPDSTAAAAAVPAVRAAVDPVGPVDRGGGQRGHR